MKPPATIIVGEVVRLRDKLDWYERLPLFGKRIVVTRAREQADALAARLHALGADVDRSSRPSKSVRPPTTRRSTARSPNCASYDWLIFTSANGVRFFLERLDRSAADLRALRARICAIGPATRAAVEALHLKVDLMGKEYVAEGLLEAFAASRPRRQARSAAARRRRARPRARRTRPPRRHVDVVEAYRTVDARDALRTHRATSLAARPGLHHLHQFLHRAELRRRPRAPTRCAASVAAPSARSPPQTARDLGVEVAAQARVFTIEGLVEAVLANCAKLK